ncbi:MAG: site-specific integrase [Pseudomonadales bacterium]
MQAKLSSTTIKQLLPSDKPYEVVDTQLKGFLLRVQPSGRKTYYYSYRSSGGARKRIKLGVVGDVTPAQARDEATKRASEVTQGVDVQKAKVAARRAAQEARSRTLRAFLDNHYKPWVLAHLKTADATLDRIEKNFKDYLPLPIEDISVRRVENWRTAAAQRGLAPATINRTVNCLRGVLTKAIAWDFLQVHPLEKLTPLKVDKLPKVRFLSDAEEARLYAALEARDLKIKAARSRANAHRKARGYALLPELSQCNYADRLTPMVILSLKTGLRRGELFDLRVADIDLDGKVVTVRGEEAKSGHTRHVPLSPVALATIKGWLADQGEEATTNARVFSADDGGRLDNMRNSWKSLLADAKITAFRWHDMRHDFASKLVMKGVALNTVRELCGHADMNTTLRYAHLAPDHKSDAIALIG